MGAPNRRKFLKGVAAIAAAPVLGSGLSLRSLAADPAIRPDYPGWQDLVRRGWTWDRRTRGAHLVGCTGGCPHWVYSRDGIVLRDEQSGDLPALPGLPDPNPRGCAKGSCAIDYMYGPYRLKHPLIRMGERGDGKWRRASWDEALQLIADRVVDAMVRHGPDSVSVFSPAPAVAPVSYAAGHRFAHLTGAHAHTFFDWYGDHAPGQTQTLGVQCDAAETSDWFNARLILLWGANPVQTRIPDSHYLTEAALNGTRVVTIAPDYSSSAAKSDQWLHPRPGTDAALALALAHVIVEERLFDAAFVAEQTDLPLLVRSDTRRFLREADLVEGGAEDRFFAHDQASGRPVAMRGCWADQPDTRAAPRHAYLGRDTLSFPEGTLALGDLRPALEGSFRVRTRDGGDVEVRPVLELLRRTLADHSPRKAARITGIPAATITALARELAATRPATIITGAGINHWFHSDVLFRALHLLMALTGNVGRHGGGVNHYVGQWKPVPSAGINALAFPRGVSRQRFCQTTIWTYLHAEARDGIEGMDIPRRLRDSLTSGQMPLYPRGGRSPKVFICYRGNYLNQTKSQGDVLRTLWPKLDLVVNINIRMDTTALYSDVVLPSAHWYEKTDLNFTEEHTWIHMTEPAIPPMYEARSDWRIFVDLAAKVEETARRRGVTTLHDDEFGWHRDLGRLHAEMTADGRLARDEDAAQFILDNAPETKGMTLDAIRRKGPQRVVSNWTSPMEEGVPYTPFRHFTHGRKPWPTLTGRQQFYIDHSLFLELSQELPAYRPPLDSDQFPLRFNTPHSRHAVHSTFKDNDLMLRLQRGGPVLEMAPADGRQRGLADNDWAELWNDHGRLICRVKLRPGEPAGRVTMHHAPELYQDLIQGGSQSVCPIRITPTHLVGDYGHLVFRPNYYGPGGSQRDVRVEVRRYTGPVPAGL
ncbi:molybdopterin-dependent oxidoreductase [Magnetospirillum sp. UT-4]|uniref:molybdopterin-dependent oxidoreductase n=1 Tax=Magnetospirillum sp. UT-4 TaxID=2681467 RepID=UPI0013833894|nr:molybdopterin-dependent oxidoreductase [Magnetospirillum sp. UT-4]CAA7620493.1 Perchlorate reductase subunit alpha [Magnetospirillum sp. UT-4]